MGFFLTQASLGYCFWAQIRPFCAVNLCFSPQPCSAGQQPDPTLTLCVSCTPASLPAEDTRLCQPCPAGKYTSQGSSVLIKTQNLRKLEWHFALVTPLWFGGTLCEGKNRGLKLIPETKQLLLQRAREGQELKRENTRDHSCFWGFMGEVQRMQPHDGKQSVQMLLSNEGSTWILCSHRKQSSHSLILNWSSVKLIHVQPSTPGLDSLAITSTIYCESCRHQEPKRGTPIFLPNFPSCSMLSKKPKQARVEEIAVCCWGCHWDAEWGSKGIDWAGFVAKSLPVEILTLQWEGRRNLPLLNGHGP